MRVFRVWPAEGYQWAMPPEARLDLRFDGTPLATGWRPVRLEMVLETPPGELREPSDFPWWRGSVLVMNPVARLALSDELEGQGEFLPTTSSILTLFNPLRVIDALDTARSRPVYFPTGRMMTIESYAFVEDAIPSGTLLFKIPELAAAVTYATEHFVEMVSAKQLVGLRFEEVWRTDES